MLNFKGFLVRMATGMGLSRFRYPELGPSMFDVGGVKLK